MSCISRTTDNRKAYARSDSDFVIENGVLTKYQGSGGDVVIPDGVTEIGDSSFSWNNDITSVIIPVGVTEIGDSAFSGCSSLTSITIPSSVTTIGYDAFYGTPWLDKKRTERKDRLVIINNILIDGKKAQGKIIIQDSVTEIGHGAFSSCISLTDIKIPDSVTEIGLRAFGGCSSLTSVILPDSVAEIGYSVFGECSSLTSITIPSSVTKIGHGAFAGCSNLSNITLPDSVTEIEDSAFSSCSKLKKFTIPKNVTKLGSSILSNCDSLEKITILNKKASLIQTVQSDGTNGNYLSTLLGGAVNYPHTDMKTLTVYGYKYSTADEFAVRMNTLQATEKVFGIKSVKFVPLDKKNTMLDKIKVPTSITIIKGKSKKLSIQLPSSLKRVNKFTKKQGQVKISITYSKETFKENAFFYNTKKVSNDTIKATEKGTGYAYTTVILPNGDKKVFATKVIVK